jgi:spore coat protein CotH
MQRILFSFLLFSTCPFFDVNAQNFYQRDTIQVIEIFFSFTNWDAQLDANEATETYIYADSVRINGVSYDSCGVRYKGNSSYNPSNQKNPLRIELNTIKTNQDYHGITNSLTVIKTRL